MRDEDPGYSAELVGTMLRVRGELDGEAAPFFEGDLAAATEQGRRPVVLDLASTSFICSRAIAHLVQARRACLRHGADLTVVSAADGFVARVLDLCEVEHLAHPPRPPAPRPAGSVETPGDRRG